MYVVRFCEFHFTGFTLKNICRLSTPPSVLFSQLNPISSTGFTGDQLLHLVWQATRTLEGFGLKIRSWAWDGVTPNRKFVVINSDGQGQDYYTGLPYPSFIKNYKK